MKIRVVKTGSRKPAPAMACPLLVDSDGVQEKKR
jgi:hypothetical protein